MPWKDERERTTKLCLGRQIDVVKVHQHAELWTHLMVSQWNSSEYLRRIHHIAACP